MHAPVSNATRRATYVDRTGKQPPTPQELRIDSTDAVKLAKFFVALGLTVEKQSTPEGRQYVLAKATNLQLSIFPSRTAKLPDDWNMTLIVDDAAAAAARAEASGGTIAGPLKDIPGGKKCVVASWEGHRVVVAQLATATKPAAPQEPLATKAAVAAKPIGIAKPIAASRVPVDALPVAESTTAESAVAAEPDLLDAALAAETTSTADEDPLAEFEPAAAPKSEVGAVAPIAFEQPGAKPKPATPARRKIPAGVLVPAPDEYYEPVADGVSGAISLQGKTLLGAVQKTCGISAAAVLLPLLAVVIVYSTTGSATYQIQASLAYYGFIGIAASLLAIVGKFFCVGKRAEFVDDHLVKTAWILDIVAFAVSLVSSFLADYSVVKIALQFVGGVCGVTSPLLFMKYLGEVAQGIGDRNLKGSTRRAEIGMIASIIALFITVLLMVTALNMRSPAMVQLGSAAMLIGGLIMLVSFILYTAALAAFATSQTLKNIEGSAEIDATKRAARSSSLFGGAAGLGGGAGFGNRSTPDASGLSPSERHDLEAVQRLRATCGITAGTWIVVLLCVVWAVVTKEESPFVRFAGTLMLALAKLPCMSKTDRIANSSLVTVSFVLDVVNLLITIITPFVLTPKNVGLVMMFGVGQGISGFVGMILFVMFLLEAADHLEMRNVAMFLKIARALFIAAGVSGVLLVSLPFMLGPQGIRSGAPLLLLSMIVCGLSFLLAVLGYVVGTVEMALNAKPPRSDDAAR